MHIRIEKEKILSVVEHVEGIVEKRNTIPILSNILIDAKGDGVTVTATDLSLTVSDKISDVEVIEEGRTTVASAIFSALIRKMPQGSIIDMEIENSRMTIKGGRIRYQIPVIPAEDFPLGKGTQGEKITIQIESLIRAFKLVRDSISTEETRYYLNGAFLAVEGASLVAVSTDGHRLSIAEIATLEIERPDAIVPRKAVGELLKILPDFEGEMTVSIDSSTITIEVGNLIFESKLIDGTFPDYTRVIPTSNEIEVKVNPVELQQAIDRVSIVSSDRTSAIKLQIDKDRIMITATDPNMGEAQEEVAAQSTDSLTVGYNGRYLKEILAGYSANDEVLISLGSETTPALIRPTGSKVDRSVIMPMRI